MTILELRDVHRVHGSGETAVHALRGVTLTVEEGELVAVMGPSGSGKSTLLNLAGGLDRPTRGEVVVDGTVLGTCSRRALAALRRRRIGYVFQDLNLVAGLGSLLGTAAGLGGSVAVLIALKRGYADLWPAPTPYPIAVPWRNVGIAVLVVPLVAMLGAGLLTRSRLPIERRL